MPRLILSGELSSADQTRLDGLLEFALVLSGELSEQPDLSGELTTAIKLSGSLPMSLSLAGDFWSADVAGSLPMSLNLSGELATGIALSGSLPMSVALSGRLRHTPSGDLDAVARPGEAFAHALAATANGSVSTASANGTAPSMVEP